ncbi:putative thymidylate synthase [Candidatus Vecturithrix granuli]|uniref:Putative thymidylate synthase n=1 Tax=Vecturithrix granuli TaxID=1499967 RepID=A0A081C3Z4_VECG1|nr:putative thymidylate synthase [Candidatus Vecturithrix granuli]
MKHFKTMGDFMTNVVHTQSVGEAWLSACKLVIQNGKFVADGKTNVLELLNVQIIIDNALQEDPIIKKHGKKEMIQWMKSNFLQQEPIPGWGYSYGQRIFNYNNSVNQLENIIQKLSENRYSKSATFSTMDPINDNAHVPCIVAFDFKIREDSLLTTAYFRSQDAGKKLYADILAIGHIAGIVANRINHVNMGALILYISSLHIYETDMNEIKHLVEGNL